MTNPYQPVPAAGGLFDATANQAGTTQLGKVFPTTISVAATTTGPTLVGGLPPLYSGQAGHADLTQSSNKVGGIFSPGPTTGQVLLDFAGVGASNGVTLTVEIGRVLVNGAIAQVLASVVLTTGTLALTVAMDPFTGVARSSTAWRFFDATTITSYSKVGDVLQSVSGTAGQGPSQLLLNCSSFAGGWGYVLITALDVSFSEVLCVMSPTP